MKKLINISFMAVIFTLNVTSQNSIEHAYTYTDGPDKNPMKGWSSGWWDDFELSSVGFQYLKWKDFEPSDGNFDFTAVEEVIGRPGSAGRHIILRLYTDWFGANETSDAGPPWLYNNYDVARLQAPNGKYITDYNDPNYIDQVTEAVLALASQYDDDPRIYSIQLGVLGYWGEWHTFSFNDDDFEIEVATENQILNTYKNTYSHAKLMGRYPWREPMSSIGEIGFHNDFFVPNDGHSDEFDTAIAASNMWMDGPIGGESPPIDPEDREQYMIDLFETATGSNMINTGHYSTMKLGSSLRPACDDNPNSYRCQGFMSLHRKMGYNFQIESASFPEQVSQFDTLNVALDIRNIGVAPIYYDWDVQFALLDQNDNVIRTFEVSYDLTTIMADESITTISLSAPLNGVPINEYKLAVRFIQPDADSQKTIPWGLEARNAYILFSNELPTISGEWDVNNALLGGWSMLGPVSVQESNVAMANVLVYHETNLANGGFRHSSIDDGIDLITNLGIDNGLWTTTETQDSSNFNPTTLENYDLVIWCNTSGNALLTEAEQEAFETWMTNGGAYMGIHAATDTYRDGSWPYYNQLVGGIVQNGPNHTANNHNNDMDILARHPSVDHLPASWNKTEEYYYWELNGGQLSEDNTNVLFVGSTGSNSYDAPRPMAWYKTSVTVDGVTSPARAFYTALGHNDNDYSDNSNFQQHIEGAIKWALPAETTTYSAGEWDNGTPNANKFAIIADTYTTVPDGNIEARNLQVNTGVILTISPGSYVEVSENLTVNGTLVVEHQGSLVQTDALATAINNGTINVNVTTPLMGGRDFMLMGTPMDAETREDVFGAAYRVRRHLTAQFEPHPDVTAMFGAAINFADDNTNTTVNGANHTGGLNPGEAYWIRPQVNGASDATFDYTHTEGTLNTGDVIFNLEMGFDGTENGSPNLLANPYPSAISATAFMAANGIGNLYFWEHNTQPNASFPGQYSANFSMEDISSINAAGVGNPSATGGTTPTDVLASMQGFGMKAAAAGPATFTNAMRITSANNTLRTASDLERDIVRLNVASINYERGSTTTVAFLEEATVGLDEGMDSKRMANIVSIYTHLADGSDAFGIQSREVYSDNVKIPVGFQTLIEEETTYRITLSDIQGANLTEATPYLIDNYKGTVTNLNESDYEFSSNMGRFDARFTLQ